MEAMAYADMVDRFPIGTEVANRNPPECLHVPHSMRVVGYDPEAYGRPMLVLHVTWTGFEPYDIACDPEGYVPLAAHEGLALRLNTIRMARILAQALPYMPDEMLQQAKDAIQEAAREHDFDAPALGGAPDDAPVVNY